MRVRLLTNFRGRETGEVLWKLGTVHDVAPELAAMLIRDRKASPVDFHHPMAAPAWAGVAAELRRRVALLGQRRK